MYSARLLVQYHLYSLIYYQIYSTNRDIVILGHLGTNNGTIRVIPNNHQRKKCVQLDSY